MWGFWENRCKWKILRIWNCGLYLLHIRTYFLSGSSGRLWRTLSDRKWIIANYWFTKNKVKVSLWKTLKTFNIWYETEGKRKIKQERKCLQCHNISVNPHGTQCTGIPCRTSRDLVLNQDAAFYNVVVKMGIWSISLASFGDTLSKNPEWWLNLLTKISCIILSNHDNRTLLISFDDILWHQSLTWRSSTESTWLNISISPVSSLYTYAALFTYSCNGRML